MSPLVRNDHPVAFNLNIQIECHGKTTVTGKAARSVKLGHDLVTMADEHLYIERRPEGDYAVRRPKSERASATGPTQAEAIEIARKLNPGVAPDVERGRNTDKGGRDKWRKA